MLSASSVVCRATKPPTGNESTAVVATALQPSTGALTQEPRLEGSILSDGNDAPPGEPSLSPSPKSSAPSSHEAPPAPASATALSPDLDEVLVDMTGRTLPQTDQKPTMDSPGFNRRVRLLFEAIRDDEPARALSSFFPVRAYREVKAVAQPERDWQYRLVRAFERDVHDYHRQLGIDAARAELLGVKSAEDRARWMSPGSEGNKLGYWRTLRSTLLIRDSSGHKRELEITSLISWRGEWYVVHLHGFK